MKVLFTSPNIVILQNHKNLLDLENIPCEIINENLIQLAGAVPAHTCGQLVVFSEENLKRGREIITQSEEIIGEDWLCECGEEHNSQFTQCWSCGARPGWSAWYWPAKRRPKTQL